MGGIFSKPKTPALPPVPTGPSAAELEAKKKAAQAAERQRLLKGKKSAIVTSARGILDNVADKRKLGDV
jgi:hypothetical protein